MRSVTQFELAWELYQARVDVADIGVKVSRDRATVYRWIAGVKKLGIREFVRRKKECKRRRQPRKISPDIKRLICNIRRDKDWCGQKIQKELKENHGIHVCLMTIYRVLKPEFRIGSAWRKYRKRGETPKAAGPREVIQHDTVNFGELFAFTSIDIFTKEPSVIIMDNLLSESGVIALREQTEYFGRADLHQSDQGPEFEGEFPNTVKHLPSTHRYSRPYKKNDQSFIENFNRSLRKECLGWGKYKREDRKRLQDRVDNYLYHFIYERWHMGLPGMMTPAQFIQWYTEQNQPTRTEKTKVAFAL
jgi:IS30 family transposase